MRLFPSVPLLVLMAAAVTAAPPDVPATIQAEPGQLVRIVVKTPVDKDGKPTTKIGHLRNFKDGDAFWGELVSPTVGERHFVYQPPLKAPQSHSVRGASGDITMTHTLGFFTVGEDSGSATTISVTYPAPAPVVPPTPPTPPAPKPDDPKPAPPAPTDPPPIPGDGLQVMMTYDPLNVTTLTEAQKAVIYGQDVRSYLRANTVTSAANGNMGWQIWPTNVDPSGAVQLWQDAFKRPRKSDNWIIVSNGKTGYEGPLPTDKDAALTLLKKYAVQK